MIEALSFDDVLIVPTFSEIESRKDVDPKTNIGALNLSAPIISANMDTITGSKMAVAMAEAGGVGCLHRFMSIEENVKEWQNSTRTTMVSLGIGATELERAEALYNAGASEFVIDVAHGMSTQVVKQYDELRKIIKYNANIIVGNVATRNSADTFLYKMSSSRRPDAFKVGIGGGSLCTTRVVTGCGLPTFASVMEFKNYPVPIIADGGIRNSGDIVKALAAGAVAVMIGGLLSGTEETPGEIVAFEHKPDYIRTYGNYKEAPETLWHKRYRGSASRESYLVQNKLASHRAPEGESTVVRYKGKAQAVIENLMGGLRSGMSYVGAKNLTELKENATFVRVTDSGKKESRAHAKE